ncbi:MAG TPA: M20/M25/M40 family metallo-hydrolase [Pseudonocardiaceae bacterium]
MVKFNRRRLLAGTAALAGLALSGLGPGTAAAANRWRTGAVNPPKLGPGDRAVIAQIDVARAVQHLRVLSEQIGPRVGGTESERRAAEYIADQLRRLDYRVEMQSFPVADKYLGQVRLSDGTSWQTGSSPHAAQNTTVEGELVDAGTGGEVDYPRAVTGKVVLLDRDTPRQTEQVRTAVRHGAAAVLLVNVPTTSGRRAGAFSPALSEAFGVPVLGVGQAHGEWLRERLAAGTVRVTVGAEHHGNLTSYNVIAERSATFPNPQGQVVMVSAHYDSVPGSPGANDDGSGTALCLELARALRRLPTQRAIRFALWGSEEQGLLGSRHYVSQLDDAAAGRIVGCFQNDMVATSHDPARVYWLLSVDGGNNTTTQAVAAAAARLGYTPRVDGPVARGSSDHVPFHERGIAAANFSWRGEGGPAELEPIYHTPEDSVEANISVERLQVSLELIGCAVYDVARS